MFADFGDHPASKMHEFNVKLLLLDLSAVFMISCYIYIYGRQPQVILTNVLRTRIGRKYVDSHILIDSNLSDAEKLQLGQLASSSVASAQTCQILSSPHESSFLSERYVTPY